MVDGSSFIAPVSLDSEIEWLPFFFSVLSCSLVGHVSACQFRTLAILSGMRKFWQQLKVANSWPVACHAMSYRA